MSCVIVCNRVEQLPCGCNTFGGSNCGVFKNSDDKSNRSRSQRTGTPIAYCYRVNSYKYEDNNKKNIDDVKCADFDVKKELDHRDDKHYWVCTGNQDINRNPIKICDEISVEQQICCSTINNVITAMNAELSDRTKHVWYNSLSSTNYIDLIGIGSIILANNQSQIFDILKKIKDIMNQEQDGIILSGELSSYVVKDGDMINTDDLNRLCNELYWIRNDCVCYSDCTGFLVGHKRTCTCNIACGCNYS